MMGDPVTVTVEGRRAPELVTGACLLCLKKIDLGGSPAKGVGTSGDEEETGGDRSDLYVRFLQFCSRHLKLSETTGIFLKAARENGGGRVQAFCADCGERVTVICDLYRDLQLVRLRLVEKLGGLEGEMRRASEKVGKNLMRALLKVLREQLKVPMMTRVELLRRMLQRRCGGKGREGMPRVEVHRGLFPEHWKIAYPACKLAMMRLIVIFALASVKVEPEQEPVKEKVLVPVTLGKARRERGRPRNKVEAAVKLKPEVNFKGENVELKTEQEETAGEGKAVELQNEMEATVEVDNNSNWSGGGDDIPSPGPSPNPESEMELAPESAAEPDENEEPPSKRWNLRKRTRKPVVTFADTDSSSSKSDSDMDFEIDPEEHCATSALEQKDLSEMPPPSTKRKPGRGCPRTKDCEPTVPCLKCKKLFHDKRSLSTHLILVHDTRLTYNCPSCGLKFNRWKELRNHKREQHRQKPHLARWSRSAQSRKCKFCLQTFVTLATLAAHRKQCAAKPKPTRGVGRPGVPKECPHCKVTFPTLHQMLLHKRQEHPETSRDLRRMPTKCKRCHLEFSSGYLYRQHLFSVHRDQPQSQCLRCPLTFPNLSQLLKHRRTVHKNDEKVPVRRKLKNPKTWNCSKCNQHFPRFRLLRQHNREAHAVQKRIQPKPTLGPDGEPIKTSCLFCTELFTSDLEMQRHRLERHPDKPKPKKCYECLLWFEGLAGWRQHQQKEHGQEYGKKECPVCFKTVVGATRFQYHLEAHQKGALRPVQVLYCEVCGAHRYKPEGMRHHMKKAHGNKYPCEVCKAELESGKLLRDHLAGHEKAEKFFHCMICFRGFSTQQYFDLHRTMAHKDGRRFNCDYDYSMCNEIFDKVEDLNKHLQQHAEEARSRGDPEWSEVHVCPVCGRGFVKSYNFTMHKLTHTPHNAAGDKPGFRCPVGDCGANVRYLESLLTHYNRRHGLGLQPCKCYICGQAFGHLAGYKEHMRICVEKQKDLHRYFCQVCGVQYASLEELNKHKGASHPVRKKGNARSQLVKCPEPGCPERRLPSKMNYHLVKAHGTGERYPCDRCGMTFMHQHRISEHMLVHLPPKHKCPVCGKGFRKPSHLTKHLIIHRENREKEFMCQVCGKSYMTARGLQFHGWAEHSQGVDLKHKCEHCGRSYGRKNLYQMHVQNCARLRGGVEQLAEKKPGATPKKREEANEEPEMTDKSSTDDDEEKGDPQASTVQVAPLPVLERTPALRFSQWISTTAAAGPVGAEALLSQAYQQYQFGGSNGPVIQPEGGTMPAYHVTESQQLI